MQRIGTVFVFILIGVIASSAVFAQQRQASERPTAGQIDNYIRQQRAAIEKYYQGQIEELKLRAKVQAEDVKKAGLASLANKDAARRRRLIDEQGLDVKDSTITEQEKAAAEKLIAEQQQRIKARLERAIAQLEKSKKYALEVTLADAKRRLKRDLLGARPEPRRGVVTG
ncbi:MAG: hypothetical protein JRI41_10790, partial [Deltaproteobacteria bacterium]|nr:hypothetical protein [Deltaproteobacteria bacterium]